MDDLNCFSSLIYKELVAYFPSLNGSFQANSGSLQAQYISPYNSEMGGMIVQIAEDDTIWLRIYPGYSAYSIDSIGELVMVMEGVLSDEIYWVISFKDGSWSETTLSENVNDLELEEDTSYHIYSWSGKYDKEISI